MGGGGAVSDFIWGNIWMILYYKANIIGCQKVNGLGDDFIMHKKKIKVAYYLQKKIENCCEYLIHL